MAINPPKIPGAWCGWTIQSGHLGFSRRIFSRWKWWQWRWLWCVSRTFRWQSAAGETWELLFSGAVHWLIFFEQLEIFRGSFEKPAIWSELWCFPFNLTVLANLDVLFLNKLLVAQVLKLHLLTQQIYQGFFRPSSLDSWPSKMLAGQSQQCRRCRCCSRHCLQWSAATGRIYGRGGRITSPADSEPLCSYWETWLLFFICHRLFLLVQVFFHLFMTPKLGRQLERNPFGFWTATRLYIWNHTTYDSEKP